jgi:hypothetical protein
MLSSYDRPVPVAYGNDVAGSTIIAKANVDEECAMFGVVMVPYRPSVQYAQIRFMSICRFTSVDGRAVRLTIKHTLEHESGSALVNSSGYRTR